MSAIWIAWAWCGIISVANATSASLCRPAAGLELGVAGLLAVGLLWLVLLVSWLPVLVLPPQADRARTAAAVGRVKARGAWFIGVEPFHQVRGEVVRGGCARRPAPSQQERR